MIWLSINIYDQGYWSNLGTGMLATLGVIGFVVFLSWVFGSKND